MDVPVEIVFHNMPTSDAVEAEIRERLDKLDRLYGHLIGARVSVEQLHRRHHTGNLYDVHIDLRVPGNEIAVSHEPHRAREKFADPDVGVAVRNAFKAAERRLKDFKARQRGDVKPHDAAFLGQVSQLADDHGFILTNTGTQLYFHRNSLLEGALEKMRIGAAVHYVETVGDTGPTASKVWVEEPDDEDEG